MYLICDNTKNSNNPINHSQYIYRLRQTNTILPPEQIKTGGYYLFKEKFGMVALVKVVETSSDNDWIGVRLKIKKILYSPFDVTAGTVFETGYSRHSPNNSSSWHFEPCMLLIKSDKATLRHDTVNNDVESVL